MQESIQIGQFWLTAQSVPEENKNEVAIYQKQPKDEAFLPRWAVRIVQYKNPLENKKSYTTIFVPSSLGFAPEELDKLIAAIQLAKNIVEVMGIPAIANNFSLQTVTQGLIDLTEIKAQLYSQSLNFCGMLKSIEQTGDGLFDFNNFDPDVVNSLCQELMKSFTEYREFKNEAQKKEE